MKYIMLLVAIMVLCGCSLDPEYQTALNNYAKDNCKGKLLHVSQRSIDGTLASKMYYQCIEDQGVNLYWVTIGEIPQKYWEGE